ncbi:hypothetical protein CO051_04445 [Candidatus Roizmanbacteria bacterium CG_4_9_14_0_2_um_filter_39_13]|uniref:Uncharacterized protein n=2 Tax=Candidatus Roizmaniibacteriota TaxID=1752723 RepID=A0A2M8EXY7_9BACT|nr:MAG: hypothetical protein COY15_01810 [Candidatus Roizmanbacteria bacterium CG_4_10_14_0_2_um_filter_39_12]PJC31048.1 MAG: hypothetical protein CO051_04445 [Candidatus Roizmanbacteria bacterium CG_4_9_14_0_2_um_filter_39_13]
MGHIFLFFSYLHNLGTFFFISQSYIDGIRIDYLAPALYGTDILVIILAFVYVIPDLIRNLEIIKNWILNQVQDDKLLYVLISLFLILNIAFALSPIISIYKLIKLPNLGGWMKLDAPKRSDDTVMTWLFDKV